jgi:hypothetical protein
VVTAVTTAAVAVPVAAVAGKQSINGVLEIELRAAPSLDQRDARGGMRNKDMTRPVPPLATELNDQVRDVGHKAGSVMQLHDIAVHH